MYKNVYTTLKCLTTLVNSTCTECGANSFFNRTDKLNFRSHLSISPNPCASLHHGQSPTPSCLRLVKIPYSLTQPGIALVMPYTVNRQVNVWQGPDDQCEISSTVTAVSVIAAVSETENQVGVQL